MERRVAVTGCAGFIGSHLVERLLRQGYWVTGIDRRSPETHPEAAHNLAVALGHPRFHLVHGDLLELDLPPVLAGVRYLAHLAARPGVRGGWDDDFGEYVRDNLLATRRLLAACAGLGLRRVVHASTSAVYGRATLPLKEGGRPEPVSPYGITKLAAEQVVRVWAERHGVPWVILRYFTVYGPRQRPDMAFRRMMTAIRAGEPLVLYGTGAQTRDFTYVDDTVVATIRALKARDAAGKVINVGGGRQASMNEVVRLLGALAGAPPEVVRLPGPPGEMDHTRAAGSRARKLLEWVPAVSLPDGLARQWSWLEYLAPGAGPGLLPEPVAEEGERG